MYQQSYQILHIRHYRSCGVDATRHEVHAIVLIGWVLLALARCPATEASEPVVLEGHTNVVASVDFLPDGSRLVSGSWDKSVRIWNIAAVKTSRILPDHEDWVLDAAVTNTGDVLSATQSRIRRWSTSEQAKEFAGLGGPAVNAVSFSPSGELLATGGRDGKVKVWRVGEPSPKIVYSGFKSWVSCLAISVNQQKLVIGTRDGQIRMFDLDQHPSGKELAGQTGQQVLALALNPNGNVLASGGIDATVHLWDVVSGTEFAKLAGHRGIVTAIAWSADGKLIASGERHGAIKVWSHADGNRLLATLPGHSDARLGFTVTDLCFSPNAKRLASASYDKTIKIWQVPMD